MPPAVLGASLSDLVQVAGYDFFGGYFGGVVAFAVLIVSAASALVRTRPSLTVANSKSTT